LEVGALFIVGLDLLGSDLGLVTDCLDVVTGFSGTALALVDLPLTEVTGLSEAFFGRTLALELATVLAIGLGVVFTGDFISAFFAGGLLVLAGAFATGFLAPCFALLAATGFAAVLATGLPVDLDEPAGLALTEGLLAALAAGLAIFLTSAFSFAVFFVAIFIFLLRHCFNTHGLFRLNHC
jgi:hypothetical protein